LDLDLDLDLVRNLRLVHETLASRQLRLPLRSTSPLAALLFQDLQMQVLVQVQV
jgi:hypothetical protein